MRLAICNDKTFTDQIDLVLSLWGNLVRGPGLFKETTDIIFSAGPSPPFVISNLIERLMNSRKNLLRWLSYAQQLNGSREGDLERCEGGLALPWPTFENSRLGSGYVNQLALRGTYTMCYILKARLLYSLAPSQFHHLEIECQDLAGKIISLREELTKKEGSRLIGDLYMSQSTWVARGILETIEMCSKDWKEREGVIEKWKFEAWCRAIGRRFPTKEETI